MLEHVSVLQLSVSSSPVVPVPRYGNKSVFVAGRRGQRSTWQGACLILLSNLSQMQQGSSAGDAQG